MHPGAHARALLHYETHVRALRGGGLNAAGLRNAVYSDSEVLFLQVRGSVYRVPRLRRVEENFRRGIALRFLLYLIIGGSMRKPW